LVTNASSITNESGFSVTDRVSVTNKEELKDQLKEKAEDLLKDLLKKKKK